MSQNLRDDLENVVRGLDEMEETMSWCNRVGGAGHAWNSFQSLRKILKFKLKNESPLTMDKEESDIIYQELVNMGVTVSWAKQVGGDDPTYWRWASIKNYFGELHVEK